VERPIARGVVGVVLGVLLLAVAVVNVVSRLGPSAEALKLAQLTPQELMGEQSQTFLPTPVAALPPEETADRPASRAAASASGGAGGADQVQHVQVADTGGLGVLLRAGPPSGQFVAGLRDGQVLEVIEQQTVNGAEWLHVRTADGKEGWVLGALVGPAH
jgi:hypothetical protein